MKRCDIGRQVPPGYGDTLLVYHRCALNDYKLTQAPHNPPGRPIHTLRTFNLRPGSRQFSNSQIVADHSDKLYQRQDLARRRRGLAVQSVREAQPRSIPDTLGADAPRGLLTG